MPLVKKCNKCLIVKEVSDFPKDKTKKAGYATQCKICKALAAKRWRESDPEKTKILRKRSDIKNSEKIKERNRHRYSIDGAERRKKHRLANPVRAREVSRISYKKNIDKNRETAKKRYRASPEITKQNAIKWAKKNPSKRSLIMSQQNAKRRARKLENGYSTISAKAWEEIKDRAGNRCIYCGKSDQLSIDHFIPISKGGAHSISNVVPACQSCNTSKWNREPKEWILSKFGENVLLTVLSFLEKNDTARS